MDLIVTAKMDETRGLARLGDRTFECALGRAGLVAGKREGDGGTPTGRFPFRRLLYRADRVARIETRLPARHIEPDDGWCDDPASPDYNKPIELPHPARHEKMWLETPLYDLVVVIGHNDDPIVPGAGSAVFLHVAREDWAPTAGCIAFRRDDLRRSLHTSPRPTPSAFIRCSGTTRRLQRYLVEAARVVPRFIPLGQSRRGET